MRTMSARPHVRATGRVAGPRHRHVRPGRRPSSTSPSAAASSACRRNVAGSLGAAAPLAYLVCAVAMGLIVLCIADAGSRVSLTGGPYAYVGTAFGPYAGFLSGVLLWMLGMFATAAVATVFASSVGLLVPATGRPRDGDRWSWSPPSPSGRSSTCAASRSACASTRSPRSPSSCRCCSSPSAARSSSTATNLQVTAPCPPRADVARTSLLLIFAFAGIEMRARAERRGARHGAHRAARDRARDARHHRALHRAAGGGAGHSRQRPRAGQRLAAGRRRRRVARRLGAHAAARRRRRSRCSATWAG